MKKIVVIVAVVLILFAMVPFIIVSGVFLLLQSILFFLSPSVIMAFIGMWVYWNYFADEE